MPFAWRPMQESDIDSVVDVARVSFPDHYEARSCFEERLSLYPAGCFVLASASKNVVKGYFIVYPWPEGEVPPLNSPLGHLPHERQAFYLHDLALHPDMRGRGHIKPIVERVARALRIGGARVVALVSVNHTQHYWERLGFEPVDADPLLSHKLESYGTDAHYMVRRL